MDDKMTLNRECWILNCTKSWWIKILSSSRYPWYRSGNFLILLIRLMFRLQLLSIEPKFTKCFYLRNHHEDTGYYQKWKVTPIQDPFFHKFLAPGRVRVKKKNVSSCRNRPGTPDLWPSLQSTPEMRVWLDLELTGSRLYRLLCDLDWIWTVNWFKNLATGSDLDWVDGEELCHFRCKKLYIVNFWTSKFKTIHQIHSKSGQTESIKSTKILERGTILNPNPGSSPVMFHGHVKDKEVYFLQQGWARLVENTILVKERSQLSRKTLDLNNLVANRLKQYWSLFFSSWALFCHKKIIGMMLTFIWLDTGLSLQAWA